MRPLKLNAEVGDRAPTLTSKWIAAAVCAPKRWSKATEPSSQSRTQPIGGPIRSDLIVNQLEDPACQP